MITYLLPYHVANMHVSRRERHYGKIRAIIFHIFASQGPEAFSVQAPSNEFLGRLAGEDGLPWSLNSFLSRGTKYNIGVR